MRGGAVDRCRATLALVNFPEQNRHGVSKYLRRRRVICTAPSSALPFGCPLSSAPHHSKPAYSPTVTATAKSSNEGDVGVGVRGAKNNAEFVAEHRIEGPRAVFPWRHSVAPLPRLVPDSYEYFADGGSIGPSLPHVNKIVRTALKWNSAAMLNVPIYKIMLFRGWEEDMAEQFAHAFGVSVAGMLANTYRVPVEGISRASGGSGDGDTPGVSEFAVDFNHAIEPRSENTDITEEMKAHGATEEEKVKDTEVCPESQCMMECHLRSLYKASREHARHKLQIRLQMNTVSAKIESLIFLPSLTRKHVEQTPALRHSYRKIYKDLVRKEIEQGSKLGMQQVCTEVMDHIENLAGRTINKDGWVESTVIAQVSVQCQEIFTVRDVELDEIVQGDPESRVNNVCHLVRFEIVVRSHAAADKFELCSWQITDWDDLLGGNIWYV